MARRRQGLLDEIVDLAASLPWWGGICVAVVSYLFFHHLASTSQEITPNNIKNMGEFAGKQLIVVLSSIAQYAIPLAALVGTAVSAIRGLKESKQFPNVYHRSASKPKSQNYNTQNTTTGVACPICNSPMVKRTSRKGPNSGQSFWGCSNYPSCKGTRPI